MKSIYPIYSLLNPRKLRSVLSFGVKGYLAEIGWFEAFKRKASVDINNKAIPWFTYSFIDFLQDRLNNSQTVFEFGSGNSTRYFASKCAHITSVEHDKAWYEKGERNKPQNATIQYYPLDKDGDYCRAAQKTNKEYDIIIIDGRDRVNCCIQSINALTKNGIIILDDSERDKYNQARLFLKEKGFKELSFSGISPGFFYRKATSLFYKQENCLGV